MRRKDFSSPYTVSDVLAKDGLGACCTKNESRLSAIGNCPQGPARAPYSIPWNQGGSYFPFCANIF